MQQEAAVNAVSQAVAIRKVLDSGGDAATAAQ